MTSHMLLLGLGSRWHYTGPLEHPWQCCTWLAAGFCAFCRQAHAPVTTPQAAQHRADGKDSQHPLPSTAASLCRGRVLRSRPMGGAPKR